MDNCVALIPAKRGRKRITCKHIEDFLGKPIIAYSIQVALDYILFNYVFVSNDDEEIASQQINTSKI